MPVVMLVALVFSAGLLLFAMPIILYVAPLIVVGLLISFMVDLSHSRALKH